MSQNVLSLGTDSRYRRNIRFYEVEQMMKAMSGDMVFKVTPATATVAATPAPEYTQEVEIRLEDSDGNLHSWYNGPIKLAIANTLDGTTSTIDPDGTTPDMVNGKYTVTIAMEDGTWVADKTATLTVSDPDTVGIMGQVVANKTCVITVVTDE